MIPSDIENIILGKLESHLGSRPEMYAPSYIGGGSINQACKLRTSEGDFFLKWNDRDRYPAMFETEAMGLKLMAASKSIKIPEVIAVGEGDEHSFIILELIESGPKVRDYWEDFAMRLAQMHRNTGPYFGLDHDNYIGSLKQYNEPRKDWVSFFIEQRLEKQVRLARDHGRIPSDTMKVFEKLYRQLPGIFPEEKPSLIHGDLWSGNFITDNEGRACILDPAVYYGHREMDIGMSKLFGGFHFNFYAAYNKAWPMENGWQGRVDICNLYPLMVHVNLFGGGYLSSVQRTLKQF